MDINIRLARTEDADAIANIYVTSISTLGSADYTNEQVEVIINLHDAESYLAEIKTNDVIIFVAETEAEIVGFGSILANGRTIGDLFVLPDYARQGIGTLLLETLEQIALEQGVSKLWVMASLTAKPFYLSRGFSYEKDSALIDSVTEIRVPCVDLTKVLSGDRNFSGDNLGDYGDLSTLTVPQFIRLGTRILLGNSR